MSSTEPLSYELLTIKTKVHRLTALVEVSGELDIATRPLLGDVLDRLEPELEPDPVRHIVLDLRRLDFMDLQGVHELIRQAGVAQANQRNFAVVRGRGSVQRLLVMTAAEDLLVLVDDPDDLAPPSAERDLSL